MTLMSKINLSKERGFSDSITATFSFVRQEFVPFIKAFGVIVMPVMFIDFFLKSLFLRSVMDPNNMSLETPFLIIDTLLNVLVFFVVYAWIQLMVVAYLKVYYEKNRNGVEECISVGEVWRGMCVKMVKGIGAMIVYAFITLFGFIFLIVPGAYFSIAMAFFLFFLIIRDRSLGDSLSDSMALVKGHWWNTFFYLLVLQLIIGMIAYVFNVPYLFLTIKNAILGEPLGVYELSFSYLFSSFGQYLVQTVSMIGLGVKFFSMIEQKEHVALLERIEHLGQQVPPKEFEDEGER